MLLNLQLLRAFAALNVVLFHIIETAESYGYATNVISNIEGWGANGVDVFFVISGFVLLYSQFENKRSVKDFLILRVIRIVPIYWLLTLAIIVLYTVAPFAFREMVISVEWALTSLAFMSTAISEKSPIVYVGWTLEWEMLFYFVFGACLWFRSWTVTLTVTVAVLVAIAIAVSNFILVEFIAGLMVALLFKRYGFKRFGRASLFIGGMLLSLSIIEEVRTLIDNRVILWGVPSALIVYGAVATSQVNSPTGRLLGDASYSIYLIQMISIPVIYKFFHAVGMQLNADIAAIFCLIATAVGGTVMYLVVEKPTIRFIKSRVYG